MFLTPLDYVGFNRCLNKTVVHYIANSFDMHPTLTRLSNARRMYGIQLLI